MSITRIEVTGCTVVIKAGREVTSETTYPTAEAAELRGAEIARNVATPGQTVLFAILEANP